MIIKTIIDVMILKYLKKAEPICFPNFFIINPTNKNLAPLPINDAIIKTNRFIFAKPAVIVKSLNGIGVNAAVNIVQKAFSLNKFEI